MAQAQIVTPKTACVVNTGMTECSADRGSSTNVQERVDALSKMIQRSYVVPNAKATVIGRTPNASSATVITQKTIKPVTTAPILTVPAPVPAAQMSSANTRPTSPNITTTTSSSPSKYGFYQHAASKSKKIVTRTFTKS